MTESQVRGSRGREDSSSSATSRAEMPNEV